MIPACHFHRLHRLDEELGAMAAGDAGGALGRLAVFPARVGFGG